MSKPALSAVIQHLRSLAEKTNEACLSDRQLLERYLAHRDESAFAVLVRRHAPLILSACRRVLTDESDVEDAFQATFLVLLRKASSVHWQTSMGNWLFGVAYRVALKARTTALRRRRHETEASRERPLAEEKSADLSWREAFGFLHEELDRLPDKYRLPLLLCYLNGKTREETAKEMGCSSGTIKGRLERGRELLRLRLVRRGVTLSGALLAAWVDVPAAQSVAPALVQATLNAARTGIYRSSVAALMKAAAGPVLWIGKVRLTAGVLLMVSLLAVGGGSALSPPSDAPEPQADRPLERRQPPPNVAQKKIKDAVVVRGRVLDPDGKPVKGARLYSMHFRKDGSTAVQRGVSDADGRFRVELPRSDVPKGGKAPFLAAADGFGIDWADLPEGASFIDLTLRLVKDQPIEGRILNTEGKPVADAQVRINQLFATPDGKLDGFFNAGRQNWQWAYRQTPNNLYWFPDEVLKPARTDLDGRFRITGAGCERVVELQVNKPGIARPSLKIVNRAGFDPAPLNKAVRDQLPPGEQLRPSLLGTLYGPTLDFVVPASCPIEGTVREAGSGKPIAGLRVDAADGGYGSVAFTDKEGRYRLDGLPRMKEILVQAQPKTGSTWLHNGVRVRDPDGLQPLRGDFTLARGAIVTGRVIDRTTGKGVPSGVRFAPLADNKYFGKSVSESYNSWLSQVETDAEGRFRLTALPGPGVLMAYARDSEKGNGGQSPNPYRHAEFDAKDRQHVKVRNDKGLSPYFYGAGGILELPYDAHALRYLDLAPDGDPIDVDLVVERGRTLIVKIEDADGNPLTGALVAGMTADPTSISALPEAHCTVQALDPQKPRRLIFYHAERRLSGALTVRGDEKEAPVARLVHTGSVIGRALDEDGRPVAGAAILLRFEDSTTRKLFGEITRRQAPLATDLQGRFRIDGVIPQLGFALAFRQGRVVLVHDTRPVLHQVKPSATLDLGDIRVKPFQSSP